VGDAAGTASGAVGLESGAVGVEVLVGFEVGLDL
jgi:hypothetical protein